MDYNNCVIIGRLAAKPILKGYKKQDGSEGFRCFMRVAVTRIGDLGRPRGERRTNFIPVVCWGGLAQRVAQYLDKGTEVACAGEFIADSQKIEGSDPVEYRDFINLQASTVQFGRPSLKNAASGQQLDAAQALQARMDAAASGGSQADASGEAASSAPLTDGANPFDEPAAAQASS